MNRLQRGYQLHLKGTVEIEYWDEELIIAHVKSRSSRDRHMVTMNGPYWRCTCDDYYNRWQKGGGSFICQHMHDLLFEIAGQMGLCEQTNLKNIIGD